MAADGWRRDIASGTTRTSMTAATKSSRTDVVTLHDRAAEATIVAALAARRPDDAIIGEEGTERTGTSGLSWFLDPIDGTTNFLYGLPLWSTSVGVADGDGSGRRGRVRPGDRRVVRRGPRLRGDPQRRADPGERRDRRLALALVATGFGYLPSRRAEQAQRLAAMIHSVRDIRRGGSAALDLCYTAAGMVDAYFEDGLNSWDVAAGELIAREAGCRTGDFAGGPASPGELLVAPPRTVRALSALAARCRLNGVWSSAGRLARVRRPLAGRRPNRRRSTVDERAPRVNTGGQQERMTRTKFGLTLSSEEHPPAATCRARRRGRAARLRLRVDLRPLPPMARRAGPLPLRVGGARCDRRAHQRHRRRRRRDVPDDADPPGDPRPGDRHGRQPDARSLHLGRRHRRGAQRAHHRRALAAGTRPPGAARGGDRLDPRAVDRRLGRPRRQVTTASRTHGSTTRPSRRCRSSSRRSDRKRRRWRRAAATGCGPSGSPARSSSVDGGGRRGPRLLAADVLLGGDRDKAIEEAHRIWRNSVVAGQLSQDLPTPTHFEQAASIVTPEMVAEAMPCGPDTDALIEQARRAHRCRRRPPLLPPDRRRPRRPSWRPGAATSSRRSGTRDTRFDSQDRRELTMTEPSRRHKEVNQMTLLLWILAVILVVSGIVAIVRQQILWGIVLIIVGLLVGPGGVSIFDDDDDGDAGAAGRGGDRERRYGEASPSRQIGAITCQTKRVWARASWQSRTTSGSAAR